MGQSQSSIPELQEPDIQAALAHPSYKFPQNHKDKGHRRHDKHAHRKPHRKRDKQKKKKDKKKQKLSLEPPEQWSNDADFQVISPLSDISNPSQFRHRIREYSAGDKDNKRTSDQAVLPPKKQTSRSRTSKVCPKQHPGMRPRQTTSSGSPTGDTSKNNNSSNDAGGMPPPVRFYFEPESDTEREKQDRLAIMEESSQPEKNVLQQQQLQLPQDVQPAVEEPLAKSEKTKKMSNKNNKGNDDVVAAAKKKNAAASPDPRQSKNRRELLKAGKGTTKPKTTWADFWPWKNANMNKKNHPLVDVNQTLSSEALLLEEIAKAEATSSEGNDPLKPDGPYLQLAMNPSNEGGGSTFEPVWKEQSIHVVEEEPKPEEVVKQQQQNVVLEDNNNNKKKKKRKSKKTSNKNNDHDESDKPTEKSEHPKNQEKDDPQDVQANDKKKNNDNHPDKQQKMVVAAKEDKPKVVAKKEDKKPQQQQPNKYYFLHSEDEYIDRLATDDPTSIIKDKHIVEQQVETPLPENDPIVRTPVQALLFDADDGMPVVGLEENKEEDDDDGRKKLEEVVNCPHDEKAEDRRKSNPNDKEETVVQQQQPTDAQHAHDAFKDTTAAAINKTKASRKSKLNEETVQQHSTDAHQHAFKDTTEKGSRKSNPNNEETVQRQTDAHAFKDSTDFDNIIPESDDEREYYEDKHDDTKTEDSLARIEKLRQKYQQELEQTKIKQEGSPRNHKQQSDDDEREYYNDKHDASCKTEDDSLARIERLRQKYQQELEQTKVKQEVSPKNHKYAMRRASADDGIIPDVRSRPIVRRNSFDDEELNERQQLIANTHANARRSSTNVRRSHSSKRSSSNNKQTTRKVSIVDVDAEERKALSNITEAKPYQTFTAEVQQPKLAKVVEQPKPDEDNVRRASAPQGRRSSVKSIAHMLQQAYFKDSLGEESEDDASADGDTSKHPSRQSSATDTGDYREMFYPIPTSPQMKKANQQLALVEASPAMSVDSCSSAPMVSDQAMSNAAFLFSPSYVGGEHADLIRAPHPKENNNDDESVTGFSLSTFDSRSRLSWSSKPITIPVRQSMGARQTSSMSLGDKSNMSRKSVRFSDAANQVISIQRDAAVQMGAGAAAAAKMGNVESIIKAKDNRSNVESIIKPKDNNNIVAIPAIESKLSDLTDMTDMTQEQNNNTTTGSIFRMANHSPTDQDIPRIDSIPEEESEQSFPDDEQPKEDKEPSFHEQFSVMSSNDEHVQIFEDKDDDDDEEEYYKPETNKDNSNINFNTPSHQHRTRTMGASLEQESTPQQRQQQQEQEKDEAEEEFEEVRMSWSYRDGGVTPMISGKSTKYATNSPYIRFKEAQHKFTNHINNSLQINEESIEEHPSFAREQNPRKESLVHARIAAMEARQDTSTDLLNISSAKEPEALYPEDEVDESIQNLQSSRVTSEVSYVGDIEDFDEDDSYPEDECPSDEQASENKNNLKENDDLSSQTSDGSRNSGRSASQGTVYDDDDYDDVFGDINHPSIIDEEEEANEYEGYRNLTTMFKTNQAAIEREMESEVDDFDELLHADTEEESFMSASVATIRQDRPRNYQSFASKAPRLSCGSEASSSVFSADSTTVPGSVATVKQNRERKSLLSVGEHSAFSSASQMQQAVTAFKHEAPSAVKPSAQKVHRAPQPGADLCLSPTQKTPMQARKWRALAAAAQEKDRSKRNNKQQGGGSMKNNNNNRKSLSERNPNIL